MTHLISTRYDSPVGTLRRSVASDDGLRAVMWPDGRLDRVGLAGELLRPGDAPVLDAHGRAARRILRGHRARSSTCLSISRARPFSWPSGERSARSPTARLAPIESRRTGSAGPRPCGQIGAANGRNPVSIVLPCHRVIGSNGSLVGFGGGLEVKAALLDLRAGATEAWKRQAEAGHPPRPVTLPSSSRPGRARWGGSGSLNPKSAPAGPNAVRGTVSSGLGLRTRC